MAVDVASEDKLTSKQERAIIALLSTSTVAEAAEEVGVSRRTLERWLADSAFVSEYRAIRGHVVEAAVARLQQATTDAVECLQRNLREAKPPTQVRAAQIILDQALRAVELYDLNDRLDRLQDYLGEDGSGYR